MWLATRKSRPDSSTGILATPPARPPGVDPDELELGWDCASLVVALSMSGRPLAEKGKKFDQSLTGGWALFIYCEALEADSRLLRNSDLPIALSRT